MKRKKLSLTLRLDSYGVMQNSKGVVREKGITNFNVGTGIYYSTAQYSPIRYNGVE